MPDAMQPENKNIRIANLFIMQNLYISYVFGTAQIICVYSAYLYSFVKDITNKTKFHHHHHHTVRYMYVGYHGFMLFLSSFSLGL
jgi:hypothetical protein